MPASEEELAHIREEMREEMKAEIDAARKILAEDGVHVSLSAIKAKLDKAYPDPPPEPNPNAGPVPPPPKPDPVPPGGASRKRRGWWPEGSFPEPKEPVPPSVPPAPVVG